MAAVLAAVTGQVKSLPLRPAAGSRRAASDRETTDHDMLLGALASRLNALVEAPPAMPETLPETVREAVRDCARALELLRPALVQEHGYGARLERELQEVRRALAAARQELAGTRDGERRALHLAEHDGLTALPNRSSFQARLNEALANPTAEAGGTAAARPLAVLFLDLDDFKPINDRHGHHTGDELLRIVAQRLSHAVRGGDMVCRLGGDEFACLLCTPMGREQLSQVAAKLFDTIAAPLTVGGLQFAVRPSIGIALSPRDGNTAADLLQRADAAMYRAKRRQLGYTFFDGRVDG